MSGLANAGLFAIDAGLRRWPGNPNGQGYVAAVQRLPKGFLDQGYANGLGVVYIAFHGGRARATVACRPPSGSIKTLARHWAPNSLDDSVPVSTSTPGISAVMGAQELGEFAYAIFRRTAGVQSGSGSVFQHSEQVVRFNQASYVESRYRQPFQGGADVIYTVSPTTAWAEPFPENIFSLGSWNNALHVSDTFPPRLWYVQGDRVIYWVDADDPITNPAPYFQRWKRRENILSPVPHQHGPWRIKFNGAHYLQRYFPRPGTRGPILVRPWANSSTDPELWYFVRRLGSGYDIFRASWRPGEWKMPPSPFGLGPNDTDTVIEDFGSGTYPQFNPNGYAFEHDWHKESNLVGRFYGETRGLNLLNANIKIVRDARRIGRLHMIVTGGPSPSGYYGGAFFGVSNDDGLTWSRLRRISPMPRTSGDGLVHGGSGHSSQGTVDPSGLVIVPGQGRMGGTNIRSLLALNPNAGGVTSTNERPYVFKRGEAAGSEWL